MEFKKYNTYFLKRKKDILNFKKTIFFAPKGNKKYSLFIFKRKNISKNRSPPFINLNLKTN